MKKINSKLVIISILVILNIFLWQEVFLKANQAGLLEVTFLDIGEGDAILIEDSYGNQVLIDGGKGKKVVDKLFQHLPFYDRTIEVVLLTHPDYDHLGGLIDVLESYQVKNFLYTNLEKDTRHFKDLMKLLDKNEVTRLTAKKDLKIVFANNAQLNILYPTTSLAHIETEYFNEHSIISKLTFKDFSLLLSGDADFTLEEQLLEQNIDLKADVLKVGHHGSRYSTSASFLKAIEPQIAVISVGKNPYGHPHPDLLERLKDILTFRTDERGDVIITTDGKTLQIQP